MTTTFEQKNAAFAQTGLNPPSATDVRESLLLMESYMRLGQQIPDALIAFLNAQWQLQYPRKAPRAVRYMGRVRFVYPVG